MDIRKAVDADLKSIASIWRHGTGDALSGFEVREPTPEFVERFFLERIRMERPFGIWVAENLEKKVVGWVSLLPCNNNPIMREQMGETSIYVDAGQRGLGVGEKLVRHAVEESRNSELRYIFAFVSSTNTTSLGFFDKLGWKMIGKVPPSLKAGCKFGFYAFVWLVSEP